ncbi:MAG: CoA-binding protein [Betaproteobacteria bacterium]|nr:CoA-binding protein [Betaproteobacteria bacterium]
MANRESTEQAGLRRHADANVFVNPDTKAICSTLASTRVIAVVGLSPDPSRPSHRIAAAMQRRGFDVIPVHPGAARILGVRAYPALAEIDRPYDLVNVFRRADALEGIVRECIRAGVRRLWIQDGIVDRRAARTAVEHDIWTVMDRCIWRDFNGLCNGSTNWQEGHGH